MNFDDAIKAHASWKMKLKLYIQKPDGSLSSEVVSKDNLCELGKWIYGEGEIKYGKHPEFSSLKKNHTLFHKCAANVIKKVDSGENVSEDIALGSSSEFSNASTAITTSIMKIRQTSAA